MNLKSSVEATLRRFAAHLEQPVDRVDFVRRQILVEVLKAFPNPQDWALLHKTERGSPPFYPSDIGWHLPSGEHYDVLTHDEVPSHPNRRRIKAAWVNNGINDRMRDGRWKPVKVADAVGIPPIEGGTEPDQPTGPTGPTGPVEPSPYVEILKEIATLKAITATMRTSMDALGLRMDSVTDRVTTLEQAPAPTPDLSNLRVIGTTHREWGHVHRIDLTVEKS